MATPHGQWQAPSHPNPPFAFFISHVAEDTEVVQQLKSAIVAHSGRGGRPGLACFLDCDNWEIGNQNGSVIRDYLRQSQFMIAWVTPAYLKNRRGWIWFELCYAEILEAALNERPSAVELPYIAPLFRGVKVNQVARTPWLNYWERNLIPPPRDYEIADIARIAVEFHAQETRKRTLPHPTITLD